MIPPEQNRPLALDALLRGARRAGARDLRFRSENAPREWAHIRQLEEAMALHPDRFHLIWQDGPTRLYGIGGNAARPADTARLIELSAPRALE